MFIARFFLGFGIGPKSATTRKFFSSPWVLDFLPPNNLLTFSPPAFPPLSPAVHAAECSPPTLRGALVMQWQMWTAFGIMVGYVADLPFTSCRTGRASRGSTGAS